MTIDPNPHPPHRSLLAASGAVVAAGAVALAAYAAHGAEGVAQARLQQAAWLALAHGVALAALAPRATGRFERLALSLLLSGVVLFCGSLAAAHFIGTPTSLAPLGGGLLVAGWLAYAVAVLKR